MNTSFFRSLGIIVVVLLALGIIGMLEFRVFIAPGNWDVCVAPVGTCPKMQHMEPRAPVQRTKET